MQWSCSRRAWRAARRAYPPVIMVGAACALLLAGCKLDGRPDVSAAHPRGASIAFESIDGPPADQFHKLVQNLNEEAQTRRLAVISREQQSVYRVRGYLAAEVNRGRTRISWVWDVFDGAGRRALRISGAEIADGKRRGWQAVDEAMLKRIAHGSMDQLAVFLTSPAAIPDRSSGPQVAATAPDASTPEAAGIFRIFRPRADPLPAEQADAMPAGAADAVPLPRRRPATVTLAAAARR